MATPLPLTSEELKGFGLFKTRPWGSMFGPKWDGPDHLKLPRGLREKNERLKTIAKLLLEGKSRSYINKTTGLSSYTTKNLRKILVHYHGEIYCGCGLPSNHADGCFHRTTRVYTRKPANAKVRGNWKTRYQHAYYIQHRYESLEKQKQERRAKRLTTSV